VVRRSDATMGTIRAQGVGAEVRVLTGHSPGGTKEIVHEASGPLPQGRHAIGINATGAECAEAGLRCKSNGVCFNYPQRRMLLASTETGIARNSPALIAGRLPSFCTSATPILALMGRGLLGPAHAEQYAESPGGCS
jgi:hypothetical protein